MTHNPGPYRSARRIRFGTMLAFAVGTFAACDGLLDVELPGQVTEPLLWTPDQAPLVVNSAIASLECSFSAFVSMEGGNNDDAFINVIAWTPWGSSAYRTAPTTTSCFPAYNNGGWWSPLQAGRYMGEEAYRRIDEWPAADVLGNREQLLAQAAVYNGFAYEFLGTHFCEMAVDGGPLMSPDQTLAQAEEWLTTALGHIGTTGDFAIPDGVTPSVKQLAHLLRARARYARGDNAGAAADAGQIEMGFMAWITRDAGGEQTRWNRIVASHNDQKFTSVRGPIEHWTGPGDWPAVIPFTGYQNLGVLPDGRAVTEAQYPITTDADPTAVTDPRVPVVFIGQFNNYPAWQQQKYTSVDDDIPLANWEEAWLLLARIEGGQAAVDRVNEIRTFHGLPLVTYVDPGNAAQIRNMIIEEERRSLFLEGRFYAKKIQEGLWFPRAVGTNGYPHATYPYGGAVRMTMPTAEFDLNSNLTEADRGTLCVPGERPVI